MIFGICSVTPVERVSEKAIHQGILLWAEAVKLTPAHGISRDVIEEWAAKMAFAGKELSSAFKKIWKETPTGSKSKVLQQLKARLNEAVASESHASDSMADEQSTESVASSVEFVEEHAPTKFCGLGKLEVALQAVAREKTPAPSPSTTAASPSLNVKSVSPSSLEGADSKSKRFELPPCVGS